MRKFLTRELTFLLVVLIIIIIIIIMIIVIMKYGPLRWELKEKYKGYEVHQYNIIMCLVGGRKRQRLVCNHWLGERLLTS